MSQTTTCLCILSVVTLLGCTEEPATISPDGGRIGVSVPTDAGSRGGETGRLDAGLDAGRDAGRDRDDEPVDEPGDEGDGNEGDGNEGDGRDAGPSASGFALLGGDIADGDPLPDAQLCSNAVSPALRWTPGPPGTKSYAVQLRDTADDVNLVSYWLLFDIPGDTTEIRGELPKQARVDEPPVRQALDDSRLGTYGYRGPCDEASLELTVYALDVAQLPNITPDARAAAISEAIAEHQLDKATIEVRSTTQEPDR